MIVRVWGIVNSAEVEFTPIRDRPGYWIGEAPKSTGLEEEIEIWAEAESGARGHLKCTVQIQYTETHARLLLMPYIVGLIERYKVQELQERTCAMLVRCRRAV